MKQYFVAYRFSGVEPAVLKEQLGMIVTALQKAGISAYANLAEQDDYELQNVSKREIMERAFAKIDASEGLFVLITSDDRSEGQLMEVGYARAKGKHIIAAIQTESASYVDELADQILRWHDLTDLQTQLEGLQL